MASTNKPGILLSTHSPRLSLAKPASVVKNVNAPNEAKHNQKRL